MTYDELAALEHENWIAYVTLDADTAEHCDGRQARQDHDKDQDRGQKYRPVMRNCAQAHRPETTTQDKTRPDRPSGPSARTVPAC